MIELLLLYIYNLICLIFVNKYYSFSLTYLSFKVHHFVSFSKDGPLIEILCSGFAMYHIIFKIDKLSNAYFRHLNNLYDTIDVTHNHQQNTRFSHSLNVFLIFYL